MQVPVVIGSGIRFCQPIRLGNATVGYQTLYVPDDAHSFQPHVHRYEDRAALDGTMWRQVFETAEVRSWDFPVLVRQHDSFTERAWYEGLGAALHLVFDFWDYTYNGNYTLPPRQVLIVDIGELKPHNHDPFVSDGSLKVRALS